MMQPAWFTLVAFHLLLLLVTFFSSGVQAQVEAADEKGIASQDDHLQTDRLLQESFSSLVPKSSGQPLKPTQKTKKKKKKNIPRLLLKHRRYRLKMTGTEEEIAAEVRRLQTVLFGPSSTPESAQSRAEQIHLVGKLHSQSSNSVERKLLLTHQNALRQLWAATVKRQNGRTDGQLAAEIKAARKQVEVTKAELKKWYQKAVSSVLGSKSHSFLGPSLSGMGLLAAAGLHLVISQKTLKVKPNMQSEDYWITLPRVIHENDPLWSVFHSLSPEENDGVGTKADQQGSRLNLTLVACGVVLFFLLLLNGVIFYHCTFPGAKGGSKFQPPSGSATDGKSISPA